MLSSLSRRLRRTALAAMFLVLSPLGASAMDPCAGFEGVPITDFPSASTNLSSACCFELDGTDELCGWGTHDSAPVARVASLDTLTADRLEDDEISGKPMSPASVASVLLGAMGIHVQQVTEPFAMVGPGLAETMIASQWAGAITKVDELRDWYQQYATKVESAKAKQMAAESLRVAEDRQPIEHVVSLASLLAPWAAGPSDDRVPNSIGNYVELADAIHAEAESEAEDQGIQVTKLDPLVGGAAMVATIRESYLPYDLSASDLELWNVFPTADHPFSVLAEQATTQADDDFADDCFMDDVPAVATLCHQEEEGHQEGLSPPEGSGHSGDDRLVIATGHLQHWRASLSQWATQVGVSRSDFQEGIDLASVGHWLAKLVPLAPSSAQIAATPSGSNAR